MRQARERAGLTRQALGVRSGLDVNVAGPRINQYENGVHQPRQETVLELAKALGVPAAYLTTSDETLARLLLAWPALTVEQRKAFADRIEAEAAKRTGATGKAAPGGTATKLPGRSSRRRSAD